MTLILRDQPAPDVDVVKETPEFITVELLLSGVKLLMNVCNSQMYLKLSTLMRSFHYIMKINGSISTNKLICCGSFDVKSQQALKALL